MAPTDPPTAAPMITAVLSERERTLHHNYVIITIDILCNIIVFVPGTGVFPIVVAMVTGGGGSTGAATSIADPPGSQITFWGNVIAPSIC